MAKKQIDKETLIKNRFWIILGSIVPLVLFTIIWLATVVASDNAYERRETEKTKRLLESKADSKATNQEFAALKDREQKLIKHRTTVWEAAWKIQENLMTWPAPMLKDREFKPAPLRFGDPLAENPQQDERLRIKFATDNEGYKTQLDPLVKMIDPVDFPGGWQNVVQHVKNWKRGETGPPTIEEVWLAQEDLWIQRELFMAIREANNVVGKLKKVTDAKEQPPKPNGNNRERFRERFRNPYWQLDLILAEPAAQKYVLRGTIKNVGEDKQVIKELAFKVYLAEGAAEAERMVIQGGIVGVGEEIPLRFKVPGQNALQNDLPLSLVASLDGLIGVEQVMDGVSVPVKQILKISIPAQSQRTFEQLQKPRFSTDVREAPPPNLESLPPAEKEKLLNRLRSSRTPNGLERLRYLDVNEQVRRVPLGIVLLVDQAHVQDVLTAFANSQRPGSILRLQPTQVDWHRYRGEFKPKTGDAKAPKKKPADGTPEAKPEEEGKMAAEQQFNLVELAFYGIVSLYERYPPRAAPKTEGETANAAQ
jgi:hypothetical protein